MASSSLKVMWDGSMLFSLKKYITLLFGSSLYLAPEKRTLNRNIHAHIALYSIDVCETILYYLPLVSAPDYAVQLQYFGGGQ